MAFEIISGRNEGYPCIAELNERESAAFVQPVCELLFAAGKEGYPVIASVPEIDSGLAAPFPEYMMACFGENVNGGLPWIRELKAVRSKTESSLYYMGRQVQGMYFNGNPCETAYCNGKKAFVAFLTREKIV